MRRFTVRGRRQTARLDADHERAGRVAVLVEELVALRRTAAHDDATRRLDELDAAARDLAAGRATHR